MKLQINKISNEATALTETKQKTKPYHVHYNMHINDTPVTKNILTETKMYGNKLINTVTNMALFNLLIIIVVILIVLIILKKFNVVKLMKKIKIL